MCIIHISYCRLQSIPACSASHDIPFSLKPSLMLFKHLQTRFPVSRFFHAHTSPSLAMHIPQRSRFCHIKFLLRIRHGSSLFPAHNFQIFHPSSNGRHCRSSPLSSDCPRYRRSHSIIIPSIYYIIIIIIIIIIKINITSIALTSSGDRARKRNKTKSSIKFKSRGHTGVVISMRGRRQFKVEKQF